MVKHISFLIKPSSCKCNMRCRYCFYFDEVKHRKIKDYGFMEEDVMQVIIDRALKTSDDASITFAFQGGEPTMIGLAYYQAFVAYVNKHKTKQTIHYSIQTNGLNLEKNWYEFLKENNFLVGISIDGYSTMHNTYRLDHALNHTYSKVMKCVEQLKAYKIPFNVLTVLTNELSKHPTRLYQFYKNHDLEYIQLIPCLDDLDESSNMYALTPKQFASFYKTFFDLWFDEFMNGRYRSITLFDNLLLLAKRRAPIQCGMLGKCAPQFVIESNGDVFPCDFYALDIYKCGNIKVNDLEDVLQHPNMKKFLNEERKECDVCNDCPFERMCYKNCKRYQVAYYTLEYCGYREFLEYAIQRIVYIASNYS